MVSDRAFIFHIYILLGETLSLVPRSNIKVTVLEKMAVCRGIHVSHTHLVFTTLSNSFQAIEFASVCLIIQLGQ